MTEEEFHFLDVIEVTDQRAKATEGQLGIKCPFCVTLNGSDAESVL